MSLNGLDDVKVKEAHETAAAEPGGWFLLKYSSRDEVELLGKGNGGIVEIRNAIAAYEEPTPLFGFLRYRRRNVVLKYVPEDCSRLVQARVAVHFSAVTERFHPHDTIFSITSSEELKDSTLSAACSPHTASASTSSSTSSLRRRRLMEITEDEEEDNRAKRQSTVPEDRATTAKQFDIPVFEPAPLVISLSDSLPTGPPPSSTDYRALIADLETSPPPPREIVIQDILRPKSPTKSIDERRKSSQSTRPDLHTYSSYGSNGRPKIKLGPRPSLDVGGRPHTSASGSSSHFRPVSSLPAGLKLSKTPSKREHKDRPHTQDPPSMTISPPPIPEDTTFSSSTPLRPHTSGGRPTTSSGVSMRPLASPGSMSMSSKFPLMTPEKARLMKALELRKKRETAALNDLTVLPKEALPQTSLPIVEESRISSAPSKEVQDTLLMLNDMAETADTSTDSGIAFDARSTLKTDESDATRSDSTPVSPVGASEKAESTRASSISESTDETIREPVAAKPITPVEEISDATPTSSSESTDETIREPIVAKPVKTKKINPDATPDSTPEPKLATEAQDVQAPTRAEKVESLYMLQPHTYIPATRSPVVETEKDIGQEEAADYGMPPPWFHPSPVAVQEEDVDSGMPSTTLDPTTQADPFTLQDPGVVVSMQREAAAEVRRDDASSNTVDEASEPESNPPPMPVKEWKIPRSKFSRQDLGGELASPEVPKQPLPSNEPRVQVAEKSPTASMFSKSSLDNKRRRPRVDPIRTDGLTEHSAADSDHHLSSDEELMDELQSAIVQEAMPMTVKSPIQSEFPSPTAQKSNRFSRTFSNPMRKDKSDSKLLGFSKSSKPEEKRSVSASAAYLSKINQQESRPVAKKVNLGSGISQRIKALEKLSSTAPGATPPPAAVATPGITASFFSIRKANSVRENSSPSVAERANSLSRNPTPPSISRESSPEVSKARERSGSIKSRVEAFTSSPTPLAKIHKPTTESISVTARILRDPAHAQQFPAKPEVGKDLSDFTPVDLKASPLLITHQRAGAEPPKETIQDRRLSRESSSSTPKANKRERRSSVTVIKDFISDMSEGRSSFSDRRRSMNIEVSSSPKSPSKSPSRPPSTHTTRPISISSRLSISSRGDMRAPSPPLTAGSTSSNNEDPHKPEKKSSRATRLIRRMSSSLSSNRKTVSHAMSPTVREESEPLNFNESRSLASSHPSQGSAAPTPTLNLLGEVNVQFPDSLLWKRRSMAIDSQGYLILIASGNGKDTKGGPGASRRLHFSEFRVPAIPDVEMQELPNSVVLDFVEGGGLQVACEDRAGQGRILKVLQESHRVWAAYGQ